MPLDNDTQYVTLHNAATGTASGTAITVDLGAGAQVALSGPFVATISWEATNDRTSWYAVLAFHLGTGASAATATLPGLYVIAAPSALAIRARISAYTSGAVTAYGRRLYHDAVLPSMQQPSSVRADYDGSGNLVYFGKAEPQVASSDALWQVRKLTYDASGNLTRTQWADGDRNFDNVWDNRTSLTYS